MTTLPPQQHQQQEPALPPHSDNVEEELNRIRLALDTVYAPHAAAAPATTTPNPSNNDWIQQRQFANRYLTSFQSTAVSWMVCDRLLWETADPNNTSTPEQVMKLQQRQFFAAQTLHTKCRSDHDVQQLLQQNQQQQQQQQQQPHNQQQGGESTSSQPSAVTATTLNNNPVLMSLRDSLLQHLNRSVAATSANNNAPLTTRLAMCISALAVQMQWTTIIHDVVVPNNTSTAVDFYQAQSILFLLRALPEECASDRLHLLDDNARFAMRDHLIDTSATVFAFFLHHVSTAAATTTSVSAPADNDTNNNKLTHRVLNAWYAWIRYVPIRPHVIAESQLLSATVQVFVAKPETLSANVIEQAADALVEILRMYPSHGPPDNQVLVQRMLTLLSNLPLHQVLAAAAANNNDDNLDDDDTHHVRDYCRIVTEMGESYLSWILMAASSSRQEEQDAAFHLVDWVLLCSSQIANADVAGITLHFWYRLVMDLEETQPYQWRQELIDLYSTRLLQFITVCAQNLLKFPPDIDDIAQDQVEEIHRHRFYVSETVEDCCRLLGGHVVLQRIAELLHDSFQQQQQQDWRALESCLSCLVAIHKFVPEDENQTLPFVFEQVVPSLAQAAQQQQQQPSTTTPPPVPPPPLRFTISKVIGKFARWLAVRARSNPNLMPPLLPFLAQGLTISECAPASATAIKELCLESHPQAFAIGQPVLELYEQVAASNVAALQQQQQQPPPLDLRSELELLEGVCLALTKHIHTDPNNAAGGTAFLQRLVQPIGNRLVASVNSATASPRTLLPDIQRLAIVVQHLKLVPDASQQQHPLVELMQSLWTILEAMVTRFPNDSNTAEQVCRLHKHALRSCGAQAYTPMVAPLIHHLVEGFNRSHQSPFLYAASICVSEYASNNTIHQELYKMVQAMSNATFSFLQSLDDLNNHPDVVEELFYLMERTVNHIPDAFVANPTLLQPVVQAAIQSMNLDHHGAHKGTMTFLNRLITHGVTLADLGVNKNQSQQQQQALLEQVLSQEGGALVRNLVLALTGDLPSYSPKIPEILMNMSRLCGNSGMMAQWLSASLAIGQQQQQQPPQAAVSDRAKQEFMGAVVSTGMGRDDFYLAVRAFQNACNRQRRHHHRRVQ